MTARTDSGFTLIETLVAMAILAVGSVTLLTAVERHAAQTTALEDRIAARWVAENALSALSLGLPLDPAWQRMLGAEWDVDVARRPLPDTGLDEVRVAVARAGDAGGLVTLTGYLEGTR